MAILYRRKFDNHHIVFKQINLADLTPSERDLAMNEVEVFSKLHHPNIIRYLTLHLDACVCTRLYTHIFKLTIQILR